MFVYLGFVLTFFVLKIRIDVGVTAIGSFLGYLPIVGGRGAMPGGGSGGGGKGIKAGCLSILSKRAINGMGEKKRLYTSVKLLSI